MSNLFYLHTLVDFWQFVHERQEVYRKRFVKDKPPPWTADPIISSVFFTNVYRELDKGTQFCLKHVINQGDLPEDELFEILVYRLFNNRDTYWALQQAGRIFGDWSDWESVAEFLTLRDKKGRGPIFTKAHMTTGIKWGGFPDKIRNVCWLFHQHWLKKNLIYKDLMKAEDLEDLTHRVAKIKGFGMFTGYEVATDMGYSRRLQRFSEDDWANPGPGCRRAIDVLTEKKDSYQSVIRELRTDQRHYFNALDLNFYYLDGKELSMRNIEHSLCEFYKYHRAKHSGKARRKYSYK